MRVIAVHEGAAVAHQSHAGLLVNPRVGQGAIEAVPQRMKRKPTELANSESGSRLSVDSRSSHDPFELSAQPVVATGRFAS